MKYSVKLDAFEGPLDLLLHLINQAEVDIYDIPVAKITDQYLEYIHAMQELQLDIASEFLVMAATLLAIKSKMLLPKQQEELLDGEFEEEEDDPRQDLMYRLIEYRKYKEAAKELQELESERATIYSKPPTNLEQYFPKEEQKEVMLKGVTLLDMLEAYKNLKIRLKWQAPTPKTIKSQEYSIEARMGEVMEELEARRGKTSFYTLFKRKEKSHMVVTFLAILELMKANAIICEQADHFSDIMIYVKGKESFQ